jgi:O-antigen biosynthesis protein
MHFQVPFSKIPVAFWKKSTVKNVVCNSQFTKREMDQSVGKDAIVVYPPVDIEKFTTGKKEHTILSVGRFSSFFQTKKQDILIDIFREGVKQGILKNWKLMLVGGLLPSDQTYFEELESKAKGFSITLKPNVSFDELKDLYAKASIYWHGAGFGETNPQLMEHFGISTVEGMAAGCIPVVYNAGGQPEIVKHEKNGYLWKTPEECLKYTGYIIRSKKLQQKLQNVGHETIKEFSKSRFCERFDKILDEIA